MRLVTGVHTCAALRQQKSQLNVRARSEKGSAAKLRATHMQASTATSKRDGSVRHLIRGVHIRAEVEEEARSGKESGSEVAHHAKHGPSELCAKHS